MDRSAALAGHPILKDKPLYDPFEPRHVDTMRTLLLTALFCASLVSGGAIADTPIVGHSGLTWSQSPFAPTRIQMTLACDGEPVVTRVTGLDPVFSFDASATDDRTGVLAVRFLESRGVLWSLSRTLLFAVRDCAVGDPLVIVHEEAFVGKTPVDQPDVRRFTRSLAVDNWTVTAKSRSEKVFLDPQTGEPFVHFKKVWPDVHWAVDPETLAFVREKTLFSEVGARRDLSRNSTRAQDGWFRADTAQSRSQDVLVK